MFTLPVLGQVFLNGMNLSAIYVLIALGFTLLFGIMKVVNFSHGAFTMLGGYALFYLYGEMHWPFILSIVVAPLAVASVGLILERLVFRRFYHRMLQSMIGLLGLDMALVYASVLLWDVFERSIPAAFDGTISIGPVLASINSLAVVGIAALALLVFWFFISRTRYGLAMQAAAQDLNVAQAMGIRVTTIYTLAFFVAIFMTALAGAIYAQTYALSPFMGGRPLIVAFIVVILGGMGSIAGAALGGVILGFGESVLSTFFGSATSQFVSFGVVILLLIVRPWGLLGKPE